MVNEPDLSKHDKILEYELEFNQDFQNMISQVLSSMHQIEPEGEVNFLTGIKIAQLALKHRSVSI